MNWLYKNKTYWRIAFLTLFSLAICGPWAFDRISVPASFPCSAPNIRLDEAFCGLPIPFTWIFSEIIRLLSTPKFSLPFFHSNPAMQIAFWLVLFHFLLPLFSTTMLLLRPSLRHGRMIGWG